LNYRDDLLQNFFIEKRVQVQRLKYYLPDKIHGVIDRFIYLPAVVLEYKVTQLTQPFWYFFGYVDVF
jgi:hypothetical protein